ncbi:DUF3693 domain-containing protein [Leptospira sp. 96542]|nr:DUF3693 domain-containing protein [Leptospira sp. 96542]
MKASEWIERVKLTRGWESDYRAAQELGITRSLVSQYKTGKVITLDSDVASSVAEALGLDPLMVLADQAAERAKTDKARSAWRAALARMGKSGAAAVVLLTAGFAALNPEDAQAKNLVTSTAYEGNSAAAAMRETLHIVLN